jgi:hypothetical protein
MKLFVFPALIGALFATTASAKSPLRPAAPLIGKIPPVSEMPPPEKLYTTTLGGRDLRVFADGAEFGLALAFLCDLAQARAHSERVKAIAGVLGPTQREENAKLAQLAANKGVTFAATQAAAQPGLERKFAKLAGAKFDEAWTAEMVALSERALANYQSAAESGNGDIQSFANGILSLAKEKLALIRGGERAPASRTGPRAKE